MALLIVRELTEKLQSEVRLPLWAKQSTPPAYWAPRLFDIPIEEQTPEKATQI
jgi:hypothetical protein